jgi:hypothetical protein
MSDQEFLHEAIQDSLLAVISKPHRGYWALLAAACVACVIGGNRDQPPDAEQAMAIVKSGFQYKPRWPLRSANPLERHDQKRGGSP